MPTNYHEKEVVYESPEGTKSIYVTTVIWKEKYLQVIHYPDKNNQKLLHEDEVIGTNGRERQIPLQNVYEVNDIEF